MKLNSETDFVAKGEDFRNFLGNTLSILLSSPLSLNMQRGDPALTDMLKDTKYDGGNNIEEARKLLTARTKENIEISMVKSLTADKDSIIGKYVHKELAQSIGSSGCWLTLRHDMQTENRQLYKLADDLAIHYFGNKNEVIYEKDIDRTLYDSELAKVREEMKKALDGKPQDLQEQIIRGKMMRFLEERAMDCQRVGFEESEETISEYLTAWQKKNKGKVTILQAERFGV